MKRLATISVLLFAVLVLAGCSNRTMDYIIQNEPNITGIVKTVTNDAFLMENETGEYWVSLKAENRDSMTHFRTGDEVVGYYDGSIVQRDPMQINTVYAITLKRPGNRAENEKS